MSAVINIHDIIVQRLQTAPLRELIELSADREPKIVNLEQPRFEIVNNDVALNHSTGLMWTRDYVPGGRRSWKDSVEAASKLELCGWKWRAPTIRELLTIVDYERHAPAINTDVFRGGSDWLWSSTPDHESPSGYAWLVYFDSGLSGRSLQGSYGFVRAVRVGQF